MLQKKNQLLEKKLTGLQTRLQNKNNFNYINPVYSSISNILKSPGMKTDKSGLFSDNISESYANNTRYSTNNNLSRIGLTPVKKKRSGDSSILENNQSNYADILDSET